MPAGRLLLVGGSRPVQGTPGRQGTLPARLPGTLVVVGSPASHRLACCLHQAAVFVLLLSDPLLGKLGKHVQHTCQLQRLLSSCHRPS